MGHLLFALLIWGVAFLLFTIGMELHPFYAMVLATTTTILFSIAAWPRNGGRR